MRTEDAIWIIWFEVALATLAILASVLWPAALFSDDGRDWVQAIAPVVGVTFTLWIALTQTQRARVHDERSAARAAFQVSEDAFKLIIERLGPRFDPTLQVVEGHTLRGGRTTETIAALQEIDIGSLPSLTISE